MINENLKNKKILFFSVQTFNLEKEIIKKLEELGANVEYYDERPSNSNFTKGIIRFKRSVYQHKIDQYYEEILRKTSFYKYDFLFVNRGEVVPAFFLEQFKTLHNECKLIFYTWDSFTNHRHPTTILQYFDRKFTFDTDDAIKYNINFRPLFYLDAYRDVKKTVDLKTKYNLLFLGTAHSDRYRISTIAVNWCKQNNLTTFCYYYMHGKLVYFYKKLFDKTFQEFDFKKLSFKSISTSQILELYKDSDVILDINHPGQKGLTMRTFEAVGAGKKMITTNSEVKKYCFYNPNNILVIERDNIQIDKKIFESKYEGIDDVMYEKMSIEGWVNCVFFDNESDFWVKGIK